MEQKVLECLKQACPQIDFEAEPELIESGVLDSLAIITIISALMDTFNVEIDADDIVTANFNSLAAISAMVQKKVGA